MKNNLLYTLCVLVVVGVLNGLSRVQASNAYSTPPVIERIAALDDLSENFINKLKLALSKSFPGAEVGLLGPIKWVRKSSFESEDFSVSIFGTDSRGNAHFHASDPMSGNSVEGWVQFSALVSAKVAKMRVRPGDQLRPEMFSETSVNVASSPVYELRGLLMESKADVSRLEAIQSILEGQVLTISAVQKIPDVRRGDAVQIHLQSGHLTLRTSGIAGESANLRSRIRVITGRGKKELLGKLAENGVVEVKL